MNEFSILHSQWRIVERSTVHCYSFPVDSCLSLCQLLKRASCMCERELSGALQDTDLNLSQGLLLIHLQDEKECSMSHLGQMLSCHKSNITQLVDSLLKTGHIKRTPSGEDRRIHHISLTEKGKKVVTKLNTSLTKHAHACVDVLKKKDADDLAELLKTYVSKHEQD